MVVGCMMFYLTSCSTSTNFTVYGDPETQILTPSKKKLAVIDNTGKVKISNPDDDYYAFLLSHKPGTDEYIPFALDYHKESYFRAKLAEALTIVPAGAGAVTSLVGAISLIAGIDDGELALASLAVGTICLVPGFPLSNRCAQTSYLYNYKYDSAQKTNQDIQFTTPKFDSQKSEAPAKQDDNVQTSSKTKKALSSSKSAKTLKDNASKIEGTYIGEGTLKQGSVIMESYNNISISIKRKSKDIVLVNVIESDGSKYFTEDGEYDIKKQSNGKYILTLKGINTATIEIDSNNKLIYVHPRVNIDEEIYELTIKAKK